MIEVTRESGRTMYLNASLIEYVEATPDTVITMTSGKQHVVKEDVLTVVERIIAYRQRTHSVTVVHPDESKDAVGQPATAESLLKGEEVQTGGEIESLPD
ncbi:MAG: hypothetical protein A2Y63_05930 [Candidatus Riflebacteria bacterium RBG_13_59_9]|nr:MAG: hypothetical protein A2Y63_05930 [Candidatus Riflebacteria bacterium RBG_13_59_9]